jgi:hypothetical protein
MIRSYPVAALQRRTTMKRFAMLVMISFLLGSCTLHESTADVSSQPQGLTAIGHCLALRRDAYVVMSPGRVTIDQPRRAELGVFGYLAIDPETAQNPQQKLKLPAGTQVAVERVLSHYYPMVGHVLKPYIRIEGQFDNLYIDASNVFQFTGGGDHVLPIPAYLEACNSLP